MKHDLTTGTWQDDTGCPISIVLAATSDAGESEHKVVEEEEEEEEEDERFSGDDDDDEDGGGGGVWQRWRREAQGGDLAAVYFIIT